MTSYPSPNPENHLDHGTTNRYTPESSGLRVVELANALLQRWKLLLGLPLIGASVAAAVVLILPSRYTATASFVPEQGTQTTLPAGLGGLASQMGLSLGNDGSQSPRFYVSVARSRAFLTQLLESRFPDPRASETHQDSSTLLTLLAVGGNDYTDSLFNGIKKLLGRISTRVNDETSIVHIEVTVRYPELAAAVANSIVAGINRFNTETRQSQGRQKREFLEARLAEEETALHATEEELQTFRERNRTWQDSPELVTEEARLQRRLRVKEQVFLTLRNEYETASIQEVNDTPVITVIDHAVTPPRRSYPRRRLTVTAAFVLFALVSTTWALTAHYLEVLLDTQDPQTQRLIEWLARVRAGFRHALKPVPRLGRR